MTMAASVSVAGVRLAYDAAGAGDPPMIFVHGWACDRSYFAPQFRHFAARHAVAAVDLRGHGDSSRPAPAPGVYDIDVLAGDVLAKAFFRESAGTVAADGGGAWRAKFVEGMFLPTDTARRAAIIGQMPRT